MSKFYSSQLQKGSTGDEVKKWQEFLNTQGYGLSVDGIVGEKTWGHAGYSNINTPVTAPTSSPFEYEDFKYDEYKAPDPFQYDDYKESDSVTSSRTDKENAENALSNYGDFSYANQGDLDSIIQKILNREDFSYDLNGDALYQQYKDKYIQQGKLAMQDTMGQAAAMTGGYGNSYASTAGNQAYQASLENLNDIVPELYQMAYDRYNQEGQDMYNQYSMLSNDRATQYGEWADGYNRLASDRDYYANAYDSERSYDYSKYADERAFQYGKYSDDRNFDYNQYVNDRNFAYGQYSDDKSFAYSDHRALIEDAQWKADFDEAQRQFDAEMALSREKMNNSTVKDTVKDDKEPEEPTAEDYADWDGGDWESYFAQIRQTEGQAAAEEELRYFTSKGLIPQNMIALAASGARGGKLGH